MPELVRVTGSKVAFVYYSHVMITARVILAVKITLDDKEILTIVIGT